jgi:hypothetical protein
MSESGFALSCPDEPGGTARNEVGERLRGNHRAMRYGIPNARSLTDKGPMSHRRSVDGRPLKEFWRQEASAFLPNRCLRRDARGVTQSQRHAQRRADAVARTHQHRTFRDAVRNGLSDLRQRDLGLGLKRNILGRARFAPPCRPPNVNKGRNAEVNFRREKRSNETHASVTEPDARLYRKGEGVERLAQSAIVTRRSENYSGISMPGVGIWREKKVALTNQDCVLPTARCATRLSQRQSFGR